MDWQKPQKKSTQLDLPLKTEHPKPQELPPTPTPILFAIATEIKQINPGISFTYETTPKSTFLYIYYEDSQIGYFEDDGFNIWEYANNLNGYGFTEGQIDALWEIEVDPKA